MTLHQTTENIHKLLKWSLILGGFLAVLFLVINISRIILKIVYPPPPDYPNALFGKLPPISFPNSTVNETFTYSLNTLSGALPVLPDRVTVHKIISQPVTLSNVKNARQKIEVVGFSNTGENKFRETVLTPTTYQWQIVTNGLLRGVIMNTDTYDFKLSSTYRTYAPILNQSSISNELAVKELVTSFLEEMDLPTDDIKMDNAKIQSLKLGNGGALVPAESISSTQVFRLDLFQDPINELPIYYPMHPYSSLNFLMMARSYDFDDILEANFTHQRIATDSATYPIKTAKEAYDELVKGKGYISNYYGTDRSIALTDVTLGYFLTEERQGYILPVILFQSKDNFYAFVPAIKETCLTTNSASIDECQGKVINSK